MAFSNGQWAFGDWEQQTTAALQLDRLNLHIQEVRDAMGAAGSVAWEGRSRDPRLLREYLKDLSDQRAEMSGVPSTGKAVGLVPFAFRFQGVRT